MRWSASKGDPVKTTGHLLVITVPGTDDGPDLRGVKALAGGGHGGTALARTIVAGGFTGAAESHLALPCPGVDTGWVLLIGAGPSAELSLDRLRRLAGVAAQRARAMKTKSVVVACDVEAVPFDACTFARCWVEGAELALSPAADPRGDAPAGPVAWKLVTGTGAHLAELRAGMREGEIYAAGCLRARSLVNLPPNRLTPEQLAVEARAIARSSGLRCTVLGVSQLRKLHMGGLLGVGQGSHHEPRLILLETLRAPAGAPTVALVGKGVTFDSGGISIKPAAKMHVMKSDMGGAAAVLGAAFIVQRLEIPVRLIVAVPTAENMPGGNAIKPSDVLTMASGKTVEVLNTDAEGRLILADALHHVCRRRPDYVVDVATLTGACVVALGHEFAGLMGTSGPLVAMLEQAGGETFERVWPLPLVDAHRQELESNVADLKNIAGRDGGALTAAAFLSVFVPDDLAWAHVDIAGTAWTEKGGPLGPKGATGFGARLLARMVEILAR